MYICIYVYMYIYIYIYIYIMIHHGITQYNAIYMNNAIRTMHWPEDWPPYNGQRQVEDFGEMSVPFRFESQCFVIV